MPCYRIIYLRLKKNFTDDIKEKENENFVPRYKENESKIHSNDIKQTNNKLSKRKQGTVKEWLKDKGYGWISCKDGSADVFVHWSSIKSQGFKRLWINEEVEFDIMIQNDGRSKAMNVTGANGKTLQCETGNQKKGQHGKRKKYAFDWDNDDYDSTDNICGIPGDMCDELMCQGIKPWDDDAMGALGVLYDL